MKAEDVRAFMGRDRSAIAASKLHFWAARYQAAGGSATFDAGQVLLEHARRLNPAFPSPQQRRSDLCHHLRLRRRLDAAARALRGR